MVFNIQLASRLQEGGYKQFTSVNDKEFYEVQKTEVKIRLPGRTVQNTEIKR
jgi:hypothetical protein